MATEMPWQGVRTLAIANLKGGVGKSTTAMMIADALAANHGLKVLVVDLDAQANLSRMLLGFRGLKEAKGAGKTLTEWVHQLTADNAPSFYELLNTNASDLRELREGLPSGSVTIIPSTPDLRFAELDFDHAAFSKDNVQAPTIRMTRQLREGLESLGQAFNVVVFDCPPGFTTLAQSALVLADGIVTPMLEEPMSVWSVQSFRDFGLKRTLSIWEADRHRGLFTRVQSRGAVAERIDVRDEVRALSLTMFKSVIKDASQAHRWVRSAAGTLRSLSTKYGPVRGGVQQLGIEVKAFLAGLPPK